jgi:transcriptional regulator with PAS, ATPase and Fis domain
MKRIAIVTDHTAHPLGHFLKKNMETILGGFIHITNRYLDEGSQGPFIDDDVVLVMTKEKAIQIKNRVVDAKRIIVANRTIRTQEIYPICSIPPNTKVLVVNDNGETTLEFMALLYKLGIDHLNLIPFDPHHDYPDVKIAVTPGEGIYVPKHIGTVIDTGNRVFDVSTFIQIIDMLQLTDREIQRRLYRYSEELVPLDSGIDKQYRQLYLKNRELDAILNLSHEGILLVDTEGRIVLYNRTVKNLLGLEEPLGNALFSHLVDEPLRSLLAQDRVEDEPIPYRGKILLLSSRMMEVFGQQSGTYYNLRDVTYLNQLEENLAKKLKGAGFVSQYSFKDILSRSPVLEKSVQRARQFAQSDLPVLITGESGTGKELFAHSIHGESKRRNRPFVAFNCAAVPENLIESELFGYEGGAFTGALREGKAGLFEQANHGTIFLDEIGDMPYNLQSKLLRVLQEGQIMRIGSQRIITIDVRLISATNQPIVHRIASGSFRADLYYRLNVLPLNLPPLRERKEDILYLLRYFLRSYGRETMTLKPEVEALLLGYPWPGNIRELWNVASFMAFFPDEPMGLDQLPEYLREAPEPPGEWKDLIVLIPADELLSVLQGVSQLSSLQGVSGRASIEKYLQNTSHPLREGRIRGILSLAQRYGLVISGPGRGGTRLTEAGLRCINWLKNRQEIEPN